MEDRQFDCHKEKGSGPISRKWRWREMEWRERAERRQKFPKALPFLVFFSSNQLDRGGPDVASLARLSMSNPITIILAPQFCLVWDCCRSRQRGSARNTGHAGSWQVRRRLGVDARRTIEFVNSPTPPSSALSAAFHRRLVSVTSSPLALAPECPPQRSPCYGSGTFPLESLPRGARGESNCHHFGPRFA